ncbi:hypothetical protein OG618_33745 [Kitasatospora sp. NBC_01246]|uniref:hypothetical protein n=1 Tax=Kitasatospora sp. NBC_01246 TaxID=2903570 RepID=UPI002E33F1CE|nr:hypothetical protein [Kitasatospora sp. NBC_01246]
MSSRTAARARGDRRGLAAVAGLVLTVGLALTGCDPTPADGATTAASPPAVTAPAAPVATVPPATPAPVVTAPEPAPVVTPSAVATPVPPAEPAPAPTTAKPQSAAPKTQPPVTKAAPEPKATTAKPPTDPEPTAQPKAAAGDCEIRSNAGNCYKAGQFCRDADLGKSTHEAGGRVIYCRMVSGKPHWQA